MWWHPEVTGARDTEEDVLKTTKASFWRPCLGSTVRRKLGRWAWLLPPPCPSSILAHCVRWDQRRHYLRWTSPRDGPYLSEGGWQKEILRLYVCVAYENAWRVLSKWRQNHETSAEPLGLLALRRRLSRSEASFATESFASDERKKIITFCRKLYTTSKDVTEMVAEWAERVAKASSQYGHFAILASGTCSTAADVGGFIISGESSCSSQHIGNVDGMLWPVGKSLG